MRDRTIVIEILDQVEQVIENLLESTASVSDINELLTSADGILRLNGICMSFIIIGEEIKRIDRYTDEQLLTNYPSIPWSSIKGMRNRMAHGYFEIDTDVVFDTLKNDIPPLLMVIRQIKNDMLIAGAVVP
jgi:uncharacterized protein with HEPN domain